MRNLKIFFNRISINRSLLFISYFFIVGNSYSQVLSDRNKNSDYKYFICDIKEGDVERAIKLSLDELKNDSTNADIYYTLCVSYSQINNIEKSTYYFKTAIKKGLPFEQFLAGPRKLLKPLYDTKEFQHYLKNNPVELLHGPMLGDVTSESAKFWIRTFHEVEFNINIYEKGDENRKIISSAKGFTSKLNDYTGIVETKNLNPNTEYEYQLYINKENIKIDPISSFKTYPNQKSKENFNIVFGGGSSYNPKYETMWDTILSHKPLAFLSLGDFTYFNIADIPEHQRYIYYRRESRPEFQRLAANTSNYFIYDDHDFGGNDCIGGPEIDTPSWKNDVTMKIFKENTVNPSYGSDGVPGCWHKISIGDVDFFMLDGRYYRTDPLSENPIYVDKNADYPSMLGPIQKKWLFEEVKKSKAIFKIIVSPVPWSYGTKPSKLYSANRGYIEGSTDTWEGFKEEREQMFGFFEKNKIEGIYLVSADRHRSDAWKIERENGYVLYEAMSSHITKNSTHPHMPKAIFSITGKPAFGLLKFDFSKKDPEIIYQVIKIDNTVAGELVTKLSQLTY